MRFDALHRAATVATLLAGLAILALSGEFPAWALALAGLAVVAGPWVRPALDNRFANRAMTLVAVAAGIGAVFLAFSTTNYLYYTILYAIFLASARSMMLHRAADFMQVYALSFLHVVSGAVVNPGLSFGVVLFPYVVFLTLSLLLTNIRRGIEEDVPARSIEIRSEVEGMGGWAHPARNGAGRTWSGGGWAWLGRRDLIPGGFLVLTVGLTTLIFVLSVVFFFVFPRVGLGFFATQPRPGVAMSGFSDTVTLGDFGNIVADPEVVARVRFLDGHSGAGGWADPIVPVRLRGQSLERYDGRAWSKDMKRLWELRVDSEGRHVIDPRGPDPDSDGVRSAEIYLEPLGGSRRVLFSPPVPVAFRRPPDTLEALRPQKWRFGRDAAGDVFVSGPPNTSIQYTAYWIPEQPPPEALRAAPSDDPEWVRRRYLQVPDLDPGVIALARRVASGAGNRYDAAVAVERFLRDGYEYALDSVHGDQDPLADFLLRNRRGHCEYFASAMVILLRTLGIPARIVNGFYGGEVNEYGDYTAIRKEDAHAWVEVFFPGHGFVTFDPTPPVALEMRSGRPWWRRVSAAVDAVRLWWYRWVVEYNLEKQLDVIMALLRPAGRSGLDEGWKWRDFREIKRRLKNAPWGRWIAVAVGGLATLAGAVLLSRRLRRKRRGTGLGDPSDPAVRAWLRLKKVARGLGIERAPAETPLEFGRRVGEALPAAARAVETLTWAYLRAVFAPGHPRQPADDPASALEVIERAARSGMTSPAKAV